ncbi:MAG: thiamine-phosphate synthase [Dehalococcoidia bacterium]|nr:MAG: thiamine-phosphate synthase [Dehalococcoidia bacterium]
MRPAGRLQGLYAIIDPTVTADPRGLAQAVLRGGARVVQLRDKAGPAVGTYWLAQALGELCRQAGAVFIVNDRLDIALAAEADGVHLGQQDLPLSVARALVGERLILGCSTNTVAEALQAEREGADYLGVGSIFPTTSKTDTRPAGLARLAEIRAAVRLPIAAIGGITLENAPAVIAAGADMVAVIRALAESDDPEATARRFAALFAARER